MSLHVAQSTVFLAVAYRYARPAFWALVPVYACLCVSTVYWGMATDFVEICTTDRLHFSYTKMLTRSSSVSPSLEPMGFTGTEFAGRVSGDAF